MDPNPRVNTGIIAQGLSDAFKMHFNPAPNHQRNPIYQSLVEERTRLQGIKGKRIEEYMKLSKLERGIPMIELFGTPENFEFSAGVLINSLYDLKVLPSRRFAIYTLLTSVQHYGQMLDLHHYTRIKKFEGEAQHNTIFSLPRFFKETPLKVITQEEITSHPFPLRFRPYTLGGAIEKNADTRSLYDFFRSLSFREIMGEETSAYGRASSFNALMHEKASPIVRAVTFHFKANRILYELQTGQWRLTDSFNAETVRQHLESAYHCLESLSFLEIENVAMRQKKLDFKQTLLHEINEDANALRFLFTHG